LIGEDYELIYPEKAEITEEAMIQIASEFPIAKMEIDS